MIKDKTKLEKWKNLMSIENKFSNFYNYIEERKNSIPLDIYLILHRNPDPDAMGSAIGMKYILKKFFDIENIIIYYEGEVSHPQNKAFLKLLELDITDKILIEENESDSINILLDMSNTEKRNLSASFDIDAIFDHHKEKPDDCKLQYIWENIGSTCTIITQMLRDLINCTQDKESCFSDEDFNDSEFKKTCTALLLGIRTDTNNLTSIHVSDIDKDAHIFLEKYCDWNLLNRIDNYPISIGYFLSLSKGIENIEKKDSCVATYLGELEPRQRDFIPMVADELMRLEAVDTVLVISVIENSEYYLEASIRCDDDITNLNELVIKIFGEKFAGAKKSAGAARISVGKLVSDFLKKENQEYRNDFFDRIRKKIYLDYFITRGV